MPWFIEALIKVSLESEAGKIHQMPVRNNLYQKENKGGKELVQTPPEQATVKTGEDVKNVPLRSCTKEVPKKGNKLDNQQ